jgi:hypothetical protein
MRQRHLAEALELHELSKLIKPSEPATLYLGIRLNPSESIEVKSLEIKAAVLDFLRTYAKERLVFLGVEP